MSILLKSAFPTPTMIMDIGRREAWIMAFFVSFMSEMTPSVNMSNTKYCCRDMEIEVVNIVNVKYIVEIT